MQLQSLKGDKTGIIYLVPLMEAGQGCLFDRLLLFWRGLAGLRFGPKAEFQKLLKGHGVRQLDIFHGISYTWPL